jgi:hypothetical protein
MPLFGLKLLSVVVERNSAFVVILSKLKLIDVLFSYFEANHPKFNAFTIKIIRAIINSREIDLQDLMDLKILDKMNGILKDVMQSNQEWCTDHLLEIINEILHMASEIKKNNESDLSTAPQQIFDAFLVNFDFFMVLLKASDLTIVERAA